MMVKLDMTKAYDRVSWIFLAKVLRRFGFSEVLIDLVWRLINNNWYSVSLMVRSMAFFNHPEVLNRGFLYLLYYLSLLLKCYLGA